MAQLLDRRVADLGEAGEKLRSWDGTNVRIRIDPALDKVV